MGVFLPHTKKKGISDSEIYLRFHPQDTFYWCDFKGKEKPCISDGQPEHCPSSESEDCVKFMSIYIVSDICLQIFGTGPLLVCWIDG